MPIDVGPACINRGTTWTFNYTIVDKENPANETGVINYICIWAVTAMSGIEVASFSAVGNDLTTNGNVALANAGIGKNEYNAPGDFAAFDINIGKYIGIYYTGGTIERSTPAGIGVWHSNADRIPCVGVTFTWLVTNEISLHGTGVSGWDAGKILGIAAGNTTKVNAILKADIEKIIGV